jgi:hypothetical protein
MRISVEPLRYTIFNAVSVCIHLTTRFPVWKHHHRAYVRY